MNVSVYVVNAYRFGDRENHSYTLGVFTKKSKAIKCADSHYEYRGGKYICTVEECVLNIFDNDFDNYTEEIYRNK
jgi:hypothetical protein